MTINLRPPRNTQLRNLLAVYVGAFFASIGFAFATPLIPIFTREIVPDDPAAVGFWVGLAIGISPALTAATGPFWGALGDRFGQKIMIQRALISIGVCIALSALATHPWQLVAVRGLIGVLGGISVACLAAVSASSARHTLGRNIGFLQAAQTLGQVAGPLTGGILALAIGLRETFLASGVLFVLGFGLVTWLYREVPAAPPRASETRRERPRGENQITRGALFWATVAVLFTANFVDGSFFVLLPLDLPRLGAPMENLAFLSGLGLSLGALMMAIAAAGSGKLSTRWHTGTLILPMLLLTAVTLALISLVDTWWLMIAMRAVLGLVAGGLPVLAYAAAANLVPSHRRGAIVGLASSAGLIGWAVSPFVVGFLIAIDPRAVFLANFLLVSVCAVSLVLAGGAPAWRSLPGWARRARPQSASEITAATQV